VRVLVAGGAGFIGRTLCRHLLDRGDAVVCVDNLLTGSAAHVEELGASEGFTWVQGDICAGVPVDGPFDAIVNLACPASPADFEPLALQIMEVGSTGVRRLAELAGRERCRLVHTSTSEVYGDPLVHPQPESYWGNVNPVGVRSVYDEAKRFGEALLSAHRRRGVNTGIVRVFNTYGPGMRPDDGRVVSTFFAQALAGEPLTVYGDGTQTRSMCFVDDLVSGLLAMVDSSEPGPINLGNDDERTVREIAEAIRELVGTASPIATLPGLPDDPERRRPDLRLARELLGWSPTTPLDVGLRATLPWFAGRTPAGGVDTRPGAAGARPTAAS
jgi:dTDP-glucose 4,6-dehydratase